MIVFVVLKQSDEATEAMAIFETEDGALEAIRRHKAHEDDQMAASWERNFSYTAVAVPLNHWPLRDVWQRGIIEDP